MAKDKRELFRLDVSMVFNEDGMGFEIETSHPHGDSPMHQVVENVSQTVMPVLQESLNQEMNASLNAAQEALLSVMEGSPRTDASTFAPDQDVVDRAHDMLKRAHDMLKTARENKRRH